MSDEDSGADKSFEPTPNKLKEARKRGEIPKSTDMNVAMAYLGLTIGFFAVGAGAISQIGSTLAYLLEHPTDLSLRLFSGRDQATLGTLIAKIAAPFAQMIAVPIILVVLSLALQQAFLFTPSKLGFKLSKISILSNAKQKFGRAGLFEFAKSAVKLIIFTLILGVFLSQHAQEIVMAAQLSARQLGQVMAELLLRLCGIVVAVAFTIGFVDLLWQRAEHIRKNMMTRKEVMDEMKSNEGDPELKQKRRQKGQEIALGQMLADVPDADVVIVNPTHYAVALRWDRLSAQPPICVAKGVDEIAARIREIAHEAGVPIHSDPPTARALHAGIDVGQPIDIEHFMAVAAAIRFADDLRRKARR